MDVFVDLRRFECISLILILSCRQVIFVDLDFVWSTDVSFFVVSVRDGFFRRG